MEDFSELEDLPDMDIKEIPTEHLLLTYQEVGKELKRRNVKIIKTKDNSLDFDEYKHYILKNKENNN